MNAPAARADAAARRRPPAPRRQLQVTSCEVGFSFTRQGDGKPGTIYEVGAVGPDGRRVAQKLRSFEELPVGQLREYEVRPYVKGGEVQSYTLSLPRPTLAELGQEMRAAQKAIADQGEVLEMQARTLQLHAKELHAVQNRMGILEQGGPIELDDADPASGDEDVIPF